MENLIIIPTYNERGNIDPLVKKIFEIVPQTHIVVVDDNSPDGTADIIRELQKSYPNLMLWERKEKDGLGNAYKYAFRKVLSEHTNVKTVVMMDADFYHDPKDLPKILDAAKKYDMVIGSVHAEGGSMPEEFGLKRRILSKGGNFYCRVMFGYPLRDWTNAYVAINTSILRKIDLAALKAKEFAFIFGLKYALLKAGASCLEVPTKAIIRRVGDSKIKSSTVKEALFAPIKLRLGL